MLVLSRKAQQKVLFPQLGITVDVVQVRGKLVKLGIDAPTSIKIVRGELTNGDTAPPGHSAKAESTPEALHRYRNELNILQLKLQAIQRRIDRGESVDASEALAELLGEVSALDHSVEQGKVARTVSADGQVPRVLVVEDCVNERELMAWVLASEGFDVHVAGDGAEAIELLRSWSRKPDFVLMDMQMPVADGLSTLNEIRHDPILGNLRVFAVTGMRRDKTREPVGRGWDGWFQKPLDISQLIACMNAGRHDAGRVLA